MEVLDVPQWSSSKQSRRKATPQYHDHALTNLEFPGGSYAQAFGNVAFDRALLGLPDIERTRREDTFAGFFERVRELSWLSRDWDGHGAEPPNETARHWANVVLEILVDMSFRPTGTAPSVEEGIGICFQRGDLYADIECFNSGDILAAVSDGRTTPRVWAVGCDERELKLALEQIHDFICG